MNEPRGWDERERRALEASNEVIEGILRDAVTAQRQADLVAQLQYALDNLANLTLDLGERADGCARAVLRGELDLEDAGAVDAALGELQSAAPSLVLDLRELTFMDSSGARALWTAHLRARQAGGALTVVVGPGAVRRALAVTGLDQELQLVEDGVPGDGAA